MIYRELGNSGIQVSALAFGAWAVGGWMWGGTDVNQSISAIKEAIVQGMTSIDTAAVYGMGLSEKIVGQAIKGKRDKVQVFTKCGLRWDLQKGQYYIDSFDNDGKPIQIYRYSGKKSIIEECEKSLRRLETDYIDLFQIHKPDSTTPVEESMEAMVKLLEQGKIRAAGVGSYSVEQMNLAEKIINVTSNQVPYSMVFRDIEKDILPYCIENKKSVIAYSPLQRGILTGKIKSGHVFSEGDTRSSSPFYNEPNLSRINEFLERIKPIALSKNATLAQLVLNWTVNRPGITCTLVGARNPKQAAENANALSFSLSPNETEMINREIENIKL